jgi:hypothetical protein
LHGEWQRHACCCGPTRLSAAVRAVVGLSGQAAVRVVVGLPGQAAVRVVVGLPGQAAVQKLYVYV